MNIKQIAILFMAMVVAVMASGFIQSAFLGGSGIVDPVIGGVGVPLVTGGVLTAMFLIVYKYLLKKKSV